MEEFDLTGQRFGRWVVISPDVPRRDGHYWKCICDCGNTASVRGANLTRGMSTNCGCVRRKNSTAKSTKHGQSHSRLYTIYLNMKSRCFKERNPAYQNYGGRGITVCDEWKNDFMSFFNWSMKNGYADDLTLDRIDVNGNYCAENCRWVTYRKQANNTRFNLFVEINGETKTLAEWCAENGFKYSTAYYRLTHGVPTDKLFDAQYYAERQCDYYV